MGDVEHEGRQLQALRDALQAMQSSGLLVDNQSALMMFALHHILLTNSEMQPDADECFDRAWTMQLWQACKRL